MRITSRVSKALACLAGNKRYIFCVYFMYTLVAGLALQLVVLPYILPGLHEGNGLLKGLDSTLFHRNAIHLSQAVIANGWDEWVLVPSGQAIVGILAALYVYLPDQPWVLMPFNALVHAMSGLMLYAILLSMQIKPRAAFLASAMFVLFPSTLMWTTQIHRDGIYVLSVLLLVLSFRMLPKRPVLSFAAMLAGVMLLVISRIYMLNVLAVLSLVVLVFIGLCYILYAVVAKRTTVYRPVLQIAWVAVFSFSGIIGAQYLAYQNVSNIYSSEGTREQVVWEYSPYIPRVVENKIRGVIVSREGFLRSYSEAGSNIDTTVTFDRVADVIKYFPRAMSIGLFAPFPTMWLAEARSAGGGAMRLLAGMEMVLIYIGLFFLILYFVRLKGKDSLPVLILFGGVMVVLAYAIPNMGALHRMRYVYIMLPVVMGYALFFEALWGRCRKVDFCES